MWSKLWHREAGVKPPDEETPQQKKERLKKERQAKCNRPFEEKESYRWVEAFLELEKQVHQVENNFRQVKEQQNESTTHTGIRPRIIHIFDREGDISEVFGRVGKMDNTGVVVRAAHNRSLQGENAHLWEYVSCQPVQEEQEVELPETKKRKARKATLAVRFCPVKLRSPFRLKHQDYFNVYAVFACEMEPPEGEEPVSWMLLTTESVITMADAQLILRWYTYRWRVEEYHKILKSGCQVESYRLSGSSMEVLLVFLTVIAAQLLRMTYLHRTQPEAPASIVLRPVQIEVLLAKSSLYFPLPKALTVAWAIQAVARLGGYLGHRRKSPVGIQVLWRGWLELESLCEGWQLCSSLN